MGGGGDGSPYSADLRDRVLLAHEGGEGGATALARRFRIGLSTVYRWLAELRSEGPTRGATMGHRRAPLGGAEDVLRALAAEQNDATLAEYAVKVRI
jgi:transposase